MCLPRIFVIREIKVKYFAKFCGYVLLVFGILYIFVAYIIWDEKKSSAKCFLITWEEHSIALLDQLYAVSDNTEILTMLTNYGFRKNGLNANSDVFEKNVFNSDFHARIKIYVDFGSKPNSPCSHRDVKILIEFPAGIHYKAFGYLYDLKSKKYKITDTDVTHGKTGVDRPKFEAEPPSPAP